MPSTVPAFNLMPLTEKSLSEDPSILFSAPTDSVMAVVTDSVMAVATDVLVAIGVPLIVAEPVNEGDVVVAYPLLAITSCTNFALTA